MPQAKKPAGPAPSPRRWWLLVHQLPQKPDYFRVKVGRRLQRLGAVALKNSVYALPHGEAAHEGLQWVLREIQAGGGEGHLCEARFTDGITDAEIEQRFRAERDADYQALAKEFEALASKSAGLVGEAKKRAEKALAKHRAHFEEIRAIDFFTASGRAPTLAALDGLQKRLEGKAHQMPAGAAGSLASYKGKVWVTRQGVQVDRIACAWLIKKFVDPKAKFRFVDAKAHVPKTGEVRFDMFEAEFTHEDDRCSVETFIHRLRLTDRGLTPIAEIVHDIDIKDGKFGREDARGVALMIESITSVEADDARRIRRGSVLLDDLYAHFRRRPE